MNARTLRFLSLATVLLAPPSTLARAAPAAPAAPKAPDAPAQVVAFKGARLWVGDGTVIDDATLVVREGTITAAGPSAKVTVPRDAQVHELAGKLVTPGFIAAATSLGLREIDQEKATRDDAPEREHPVRAAYNPARGLHATSSLLAVQAIEGITNAAVSPSGGLISGQVSWIDVLPGDHDNLVVDARVGIAGTLGETLEGSRIATLAKLDEVLHDARLYAEREREHERRQLRPLAAHRLDLEALQPLLRGEVPFIVTAHRASDILAALDLARRWNLRLVLVGGTQAWQVADAIAAAKVPVIVQPSRNLPASLDVLGARLDLAALLHRAGVRVAIAVIDDDHNVRNVAQEAGIAIANGLPPQEALRAVTLTLAEAYGMDTRYGTLAAGKVANFVVWPGDPFELSNWPEQVWIRGRQQPMRSRQTQLRDRYLERFGLKDAKR